jgi:hypothetical protein
MFSSTWSSPAWTGTSICGITFGNSATVSSKFIRHPVGVRGQEADALQTFDIVDDAQQFRQAGPIGYILAIAVDDLPQQGDLSHALGDQGAHFGDDLAHVPAALHAAPVGDDAEGAGVRAAIHHRHVRRNQPIALVRRQVSSPSITAKRRSVSASSIERLSSWVRKAASGPGSEGGEKTSTNGKRCRSFSAPLTPTRQPIRLITSSGLRSLSGRSENRRPYSFVLRALADDAGVHHDHIGLFGRVVAR